MRLVYPWAALSLAAAVLAAAAWALRRLEDRSASLPFPGHPRLWSSPAGLGALLARWAPPLLQALALILIAAGLARPQRVTSRLQGLGRGIDIMLVLDSSLSMAATDFSPNRLAAAQETALRFIQGRVQDRIGLVVFGGAPQLSCPLTLDYEALAGQLAQASPGMTRTDGTAIGDGIASAVNHLKGGDGKSKVMILLTDGRSNAGLIDPVTAAKTARAFGVKIYTIGTAKRGTALMPIDDPTQGRVMVPIDDDLDEELLSEVARLASGRYWRATGLKQLREVYAEIDRLEKSAVKLPDIVSHDDLYRLPVLAATLLLLAQAVLANTWLLRWP